MAKAPLPETLPGSFFVLEYKRDRGGYVLHIDDEKRSSFWLGGTTSRLLMQFRLWGLEEIGASALDLAREFGAAQAIPGQDRVIPLFDRSPTKKPIEFKEGKSYAQLGSIFRRSG